MFLFFFKVEAAKKIDEIRLRRQNTHVMNRLRKARELETARDVHEVKRDLALIKSPAAGRKNKSLEKPIVEEIHESDTEMVEIGDDDDSPKPVPVEC